MAYHADVAFLEECSPALIEMNAAEFARIRDLLVSTEPSVNKARNQTVWESPHRAQYDARLSDTRTLVTGLADGFGKARTALLRYADAVGLAQRHLDDGLHAENVLDQLIARVATAVTPTAKLAEPMRRWEDIRETTGVLDGLAELGMDVDSIREDATRAYDQAYEAFDRARAVELEARQQCLAELRAAHELIPDFRGGRASDIAAIAPWIKPLLAEAAQASADPLTHLAGSGEKSPFVAAVGSAAVSPALLRIRTLLMSLPAGQSPWYQEVFPDWSDSGRRDWISANKELIRAAAKETGLPAGLIASIAWKEVAGKPYFLDDAAEAARAHPQLTAAFLPDSFDRDRDKTSYGPMSVQLRRGAEVLGYDPSSLSEQQRDEVRSALKDPAQNIFVASKYLQNLKAESDFAAVPADQMTSGQCQELAARYNGGPHWHNEQAQTYGRDVMGLWNEAGEAMR